MANVTGPGSSTNTAIPRWNGTSGTAIQDSSVQIDGSNNISGINSISSDGGAFITDGSGNATATSFNGAFLAENVGHKNIAAGLSSGGSLGSSSYNTSYGSDSLSTHTTGTENTCSAASGTTGGAGGSKATQVSL